MRTRLSLISPSIALGALFALGCGASNPPPRTTTTTHTEQTTVDDTGEVSSSEIKETRTEQADGVEKVERTETTKKVSPPVEPAPDPK